MDQIELDSNEIMRKSWGFRSMNFRFIPTKGCRGSYRRVEKKKDVRDSLKPSIKICWLFPPKKKTKNKKRLTLHGLFRANGLPTS